MLTITALAVVSSVFLGLSHAVAFEPQRDGYGFSSNVTLSNITLLRRGILFNVSSTALTEIINYPCDKYSDPKPCYRKYYDERHSCHPFDQDCYKDCHDWDDYRRRCENHNDKCYDKCYYKDQDCHNYDYCHKHHKDDRNCYRKHKDYYDHRDHCKPECRPEVKDCYKCRKECPPWDEDCHHGYRPPRYCKPDCKSEDNACHKCKKHDHHHHHDRECEPRKDRHCFPGYPQSSPHWNNEDDDSIEDDYHPHSPRSYITVNYFGPEGTYQEKVWPDGDEHWNDEHYKHVKVDHIKYYAEEEDSDIRCLPMKSWFPWAPLPLEKYVERTEEYGLTVRILQLEKPIPVELIRCDVP